MDIDGGLDGKLQVFILLNDYKENNKVYVESLLFTMR